MKKLLFFVCLSFISNSLYAQSDDYPGRKTYPNVEVYETEQLLAAFNDVQIVDVRSNYEFNVLHINTAVNIPLNSKSFARDLAALNNNGKPFVFYCNGHTCYKSYKAVLKAKLAGFTKVISYDSGVFDWSNAHPDKATLLNVSPINPDKLLTKKTLNDRFLTASEFNEKAKGKGMILDIRDPVQRGLMSLFPFRQKNVSLQNTLKLTRLLDSVYKSGTELLIYDAAGEQVRWLQYYIEAKGIKDYYFLEGGAKSFLKNS